MTQNAKPIIAYNNLIVGATLTASTEDANNPKENVQDLRPSTKWKGTGSGAQYVEIDLGSPTEITCFGIVGHDIYTQGADLAFQYSDGGWQDAVSQFTPGSDRCLLKTFGGITKQIWRVYIPAGYSSPPSIGVIFLGAYVQFPSWCLSPFDPDAKKAVRHVNRSVEGEYLGSTVEYIDRSVSVQFRGLSASWVENNLRDLWDWIIRKPAFWAWDIANHPLEAYYLMAADDAFNAPYNPSSREWALQLTGLKEA